MTARAAPDDPDRLVHLDLADAAVRFALSFALDQAGWVRAAERGPGTAVVADGLGDDAHAPPLDVLVLTPTPAASRRALDALLAGRVRSIVSSDDPAGLPAALEGGRAGLQVVADGVVAAAQRFPALTPRLDRTLLLVVRGRGNRDIARLLQVSEATTKRDVTDLLRRFDAPNRVALATAALRLGWRADRRV